MYIGTKKANPELLGRLQRGEAVLLDKRPIQRTDKRENFFVMFRQIEERHHETFLKRTGPVFGSIAEKVRELRTQGYKLATEILREIDGYLDQLINDWKQVMQLTKTGLREYVGILLTCKFV